MDFVGLGARDRGRDGQAAGRGDPQLFTRRGQFTMPLSKIVVCFDVERVHGLSGAYTSKKNYLYADGHVRNCRDTAPRPRPKN